MNRKQCLVTLAWLVILAGHGNFPALAGIYDVEMKITGSDTEPDDFFGVSVATSGKKALNGAYRDKDAGMFSGSAYLFDTDSGIQLMKLKASDADLGDQFGFSVAIDGNLAVVGAPTARDDSGKASGEAYVFNLSTGDELFKLTADEGVDGLQFGYAVAISGNKAVIGAPEDDAAGFESGSAYLFDLTTGKRINKWTASDATSQDGFGSAVAIDGDFAAVSGAGLSKGVRGSGTVYVYDVDSGTQLSSFTAPDPQTWDGFGGAVSISGSYIVVGSSADDSTGIDSGSAYVFDLRSGKKIFKLAASDAAAYDLFGSSVAVNGNTAVVGAFAASEVGTWSGAAYLFDITTGEEISKLIPSDASERDYFGGSVAISGNALVVSARDDLNAGTAYIFRDIVVPEPSSTFLVVGSTVLLTLGASRVLCL